MTTRRRSYTADASAQATWERGVGFRTCLVPPTRSRVLLYLGYQPRLSRSRLGRSAQAPAWTPPACHPLLKGGQARHGPGAPCITASQLRKLLRPKTTASQDKTTTTTFGAPTTRRALAAGPNDRLRGPKHTTTCARPTRGPAPIDIDTQFPSLLYIIPFLQAIQTSSQIENEEPACEAKIQIHQDSARTTPLRPPEERTSDEQDSAANWYAVVKTLANIKMRPPGRARQTGASSCQFPCAAAACAEAWAGRCGRNESQSPR